MEDGKVSKVRKGGKEKKDRSNGVFFLGILSAAKDAKAGYYTLISRSTDFPDFRLFRLSCLSRLPTTFAP